MTISVRTLDAIADCYDADGRIEVYYAKRCFAKCLFVACHGIQPRAIL